MKKTEFDNKSEYMHKPAPFSLEFLKRYEPLECFSHNEISETYLVKSLENGEKYIAKVYEKFFTENGTDERAVLSELNHPSVPKLIESFVTDETVCIVRSYAEGISLDTISVPVGERFVLNVGLQLCDILTYLHTQKPPIIHRDIKPQNVIIDQSGNLKLIDFGIARKYKESAEKDTRFIASDGFSPPEQYGFGQTDNLTDIYSLGRLLCWLLTGSNDIALADNINNQEIVRVIRKCSEFAPKDRYKTAKAVKVALIKACGIKKHRVFAVSVVGIMLVVLSFTLGRLTAPVAENKSQYETAIPIVGEEIIFKEPLIETAVRHILNLGEDRKITEQDLYKIRTINIDSNRVFKDSDDYHDNVHNPEFDLFYSLPPITTLEDLKLMPYLEEVRIRRHHITDIAPLSELLSLRILDLTGNPITDFLPLKLLPKLENIDINDTLINDLSPLYDLPKLNRLMLSNCFGYEAEQLCGLRNIKSLNTFGYSIAYQHLPDNQFYYLGLSNSDFNSFDFLSSSKESLRQLEVFETKIKSLDGIEEYINLEVLSIYNCDIIDLEPLLSLSKLKEVSVSENMREAVERIAERAKFEIKYV